MCIFAIWPFAATRLEITTHRNGISRLLYKETKHSKPQHQSCNDTSHHLHSQQNTQNLSIRAVMILLIISIHVLWSSSILFLECGCMLYFYPVYFQGLVRGDFKTQPPVDWGSRPVLGGCHCLEQKKPAGTGRNRWSTGGWVLKSSLMFVCVCRWLHSAQTGCEQPHTPIQ